VSSFVFQLTDKV